MEKKIITVFGGSGFVGRALIHTLAQTDTHVRIATRSPFLAKKQFFGFSPHRISFIHADLKNQSSLESALKGASGAINLVGLLQESRRGDFERVHTQGPGYLAELCAQSDVEYFIHVSALGVCSTSPSSYSRTKAWGEEAIRRHLPRAVIVRPSVIFGYHDQFLNRFAHMVRRGPFLPLIGGGQTRIQPIHVTDVVQALLGAAQHPGQTFELGGPQTYTFREIFTLIQRTLRCKRPFFSIPFFAASLLGRLLQILPSAPLTADQVALLRQDNVVKGDCPGLAELGITPTPLDRGIEELFKSFPRE